MTISLQNLCVNHLITGDVDQMPASVRVHADLVFRFLSLFFLDFFLKASGPGAWSLHARQKAEHVAGRSHCARLYYRLGLERVLSKGYCRLFLSFLLTSSLSPFPFPFTHRRLSTLVFQGTICEIPLPAGLLECARLPPAHYPLFTPSTKADVGIHDENISPARAAQLLGGCLSRVCLLFLSVSISVQCVSVRVYTACCVCVSGIVCRYAFVHDAHRCIRVQAMFMCKP